MSGVPLDTAGAARARHKAPGPQGAEAAAVRPSGRDRYLDLLRAVALGRVVIYHIFGWAWLTILFPSMGVMFALAGSLMARSLGGRRSASSGAGCGGCCRRCGRSRWSSCR